MKSKSRREGLKIIGAVGATCMFPFSANTLYGQHTHPAPEVVPIKPAAPYKPRNFAEPEFALISRVADLIIPPTETAGAIAAGVPQYIDEVVTANPVHKPKFRAGLAKLESRSSTQFGNRFLELNESQQIAILKSLDEAADPFFVLMKGLTADGYYTSHAGLVVELGYKGNTVLGSFPECTHPEHRG